MGEKFICKTVPDLIRAIERLADGVTGRRDPAVEELIEDADHLAEAAETVLDVEIMSGSPRTREAFDLLRGQAAAVRRVLAKIDPGRMTS